MAKSDNVFTVEKGLVPVSVWQGVLTEGEGSLVGKIRQGLLKSVPDLAEKFNGGQLKYFGYRRGESSDAVYIYIQKKGLLIDVRIPREFEEDLRRAGFVVEYRENFQGKAGWLTGWHISHDWPNVGEVTKWLRLALERDVKG
jgi:hypothetical protein